MREIKFRVWDGNNILVLNNNIKIDIENIAGFEGIFIPNDNKYTLMQFTGLKDKNEVDIYEGDIILKDDEKIVVSYGIQEVDAFEGVGFNLWSFYGEQKDVGKAIRLQSEIEIIGNIYEHPELLNYERTADTSQEN